MLKIANNSSENLLIPEDMAEEDEVGGEGIFGFKMIVALLIFILKTANSSKNLLISVNMAETNEVMEKDKVIKNFG